MRDPARRIRAMSRDAAGFVDHDPRLACVECRTGQGAGSGPLRPIDAASERVWIAARVEAADGTPMPDEEVEIELTGGQVLRGRTGQDGAIRFEDVTEDTGAARMVPPRAPNDGGRR